VIAAVVVVVVIAALATSAIDCGNADWLENTVVTVPLDIETLAPPGMLTGRDSPASN